MLTLTYDTISHEDMDALADWIRTYPRLTKGELTLEFERKFAAKVGSKHAVLVNSGSSANLLAVAAWQQMNVTKVVVPSLCWITDLSPVIQLGMEPIMVDCNPYNLAIDVDHFRDTVRKHRPQAAILVSVLGIQPHMKEIIDICNAYDVHLMEDTCESYGSTYNGKWLGTFGSMGTFSFYFSHHLSTIEGGMIVTDDDQLHALLVMLRAHGWDRDLDPDIRQSLRENYHIDDFSAKFTFYVTAFNVRATEIQAYLGLRQLERADAMVAHRHDITQKYKSKLYNKGVWTPTFRYADDVCSGFGWPVLTKIQNRTLMVNRLNELGVESRPLIAGSIVKHPVLDNARYKQMDETQTADMIHSHGLYLPIHTGVSTEDVEMLCDVILEYAQ